MALGRAFDPKIKDDKEALAAGTLQFKVDFTTLRDWYNNELWLKQNSLIAVAAGDDGLSGFRRDGAWAALAMKSPGLAKFYFLVARASASLAGARQ